jgi:hypothetical protein
MQPASIKRVTARDTGTTLATLFLAWLRARALVFSASGLAFSAFGAALGELLGDFLGAALPAVFVAAFGATFFFGDTFDTDLVDLVPAAFEAIQTHRQDLEIA